LRQVFEVEGVVLSRELDAELFAVLMRLVAAAMTCTARSLSLVTLAESNNCATICPSPTEAPPESDCGETMTVVEVSAAAPEKYIIERLLRGHKLIQQER
jgi:hypothetical protein